MQLLCVLYYCIMWIVQFWLVRNRTIKRTNIVYTPMGIQMPIKSRSNKNLYWLQSQELVLLHSCYVCKYMVLLAFLLQNASKTIVLFCWFYRYFKCIRGMFTFGSCCQSAHILIVVPLNSQAKILKLIYYIIYNFIHKNQIQKISTHSKNNLKSFDTTFRQTPLFTLLITQ